MLGSVDRGQPRALVQALAARDGAAVLAVVDGLRSHGLSAVGTLEELSLLLQQMAVEQAVPGALDAQDPDTEDGRALAGVLAADETQLLYSMVLHGRGELQLMSDEYGALTMVLLRFRAFPAARRATGTAEPAREPRSVPLRAPAPPALSVPATAAAAAAAATVTVKAITVLQPVAIDIALGDRWEALVRQLTASGLAALVRELAAQAGLQRIDASTTPPTWHLLVERDTLRTAALADKLAFAAAAALGQPVRFELAAGAPEDSPARRDAAERLRVQAAAEAQIRDDPVVRELLKQYKSARIVPGSIKPV